MNNKTQKLIKITVSLLMIVMLVFTLATPIFAASSSSGGGSSSGISITPDSITPTQPGSSDKITDIAGKILGFLQVLAIALLVVMIAVLGIKYMAGSSEEKAEYKKSFVPLIVGAILVFMAVTIANFIFQATSAQ